MTSATAVRSIGSRSRMLVEAMQCATPPVATGEHEGTSGTGGAKLLHVATYSPAAWHDFFLGTMGAAAALTGLLFVAISINLDQILKYPQLPGRAAGTLGILVGALIVSGAALAPGQSERALGLEIGVVGAVVAAQALIVARGTKKPGEPSAWRIEHVATLVLPSLLLIVGGVTVFVGAGGQLYWVFAGLLLTFVSASVNAWVLLVEIKR